MPQISKTETRVTIIERELDCPVYARSCRCVLDWDYETGGWSSVRACDLLKSGKRCGMICVDDLNVRIARAFRRRVPPLRILDARVDGPSHFHVPATQSDLPAPEPDAWLALAKPTK